MPPVKPEALRKKARRLQAERAATEREKAKIEAELEAVRNRIKPELNSQRGVGFRK